MTGPAAKCDTCGTAEATHYDSEAVGLCCRCFASLMDQWLRSAANTCARSPLCVPAEYAEGAS